MNKLILSILVLSSFSTFARDGFITTTIQGEGDEILETFKKSDLAEYFHSTFLGESNCQVRFISSEANDYAEFVMIDEKGKTGRFFISQDYQYELVIEQSDGSDGEGIGWFTTQKFRAAGYELNLSLEGDFGFNISFTKNGKRVYECDTGF